MSFKTLLDELSKLSKSFGAADDADKSNEEDDAKIKAAADGDVDGDGKLDGVDPDTTGTDDDVDADADNDEDEDEMLGKSFDVTLANGEKREAIDGTKMVLSMMKRLDGTEADMSKALTLAVGTMQKMQKALTAQGALIKSLQGDLERIGGQGRGRKAVLSIMEKASAKDGDDDKAGVAPGEFMAKALAAQKAGRLTGSDVALAESRLNRGLPVPDRIVTAVTAQA